nr:MAG TPA: hypothetical protein [Caudoviricetes sp.]
MISAVSSGTANSFSPSKYRTPFSQATVRARFGHSIPCLLTLIPI